MSAVIIPEKPKVQLPPKPLSFSMFRGEEKGAHRRVLYEDPQLGKVYIPPELLHSVSYPGRSVRARYGPGEVGIFVAKHIRPIYDEDGTIRKLEMRMVSITHNERVDAGAQQQAVQVFGGGGSPATPSTTLYPKTMAIATTGFTTKTKTDQSIGASGSGVTTNEFTTVGLTRVAADTPIGGDYTAPSSLGGTFIQLRDKQFTATGAGGTAHGAALFDTVTVSGSIMYVEDIFSSDAVLVLNDTLTVVITINN